MAITGEPDGDRRRRSASRSSTCSPGLNAAVAILAAPPARDLGERASGSRSRYSTRRSRHWSTWQQNALRHGRGAAALRQRPREHRPLPAVPPRRTAGSRSRRRTTASSRGSARRSERPELADRRAVRHQRGPRVATATRCCRGARSRCSPAGLTDDWVATARRRRRSGREDPRRRRTRCAPAAPATVRVNHPAAGELELVAPPVSLRVVDARPALPRRRCSASTRARCSPSSGSTTSDLLRSRRRGVVATAETSVVAWSRSRQPAAAQCG